MTFFRRHATPQQLAAESDINGLFLCVTGKDQKVAKEAVPLLAALVDELDMAPGTHEVLRDLESDATPNSVHALEGIVRHDLAHTSGVKMGAVLALFRLHAMAELRKIVEDIRNGDAAGKPLHADLSRNLLGAAVRAHDVELTRFLLVNGSFGSAGEVEPAFEMLAGGGPEAVQAIAADRSTYSEVAKARAAALAGRA
jgi:hypothetical protein